MNNPTWRGRMVRGAPADAVRQEQATGVRTVRRVVTSTPEVALTFDDGPDPTLTRQKLELLRQFGVQATFFLVGTQVQRLPEVARAITAEGHEVANHSFRHKNLTRLGHVGALADLRRARELLESATGTRVPLLRPPYGAFDATVLQAAAATGHATNVLWTVDPRDWARPSPGAIVRRVLSAVGPGTIVVLHDWPRETAAALKDILRALGDRGYRAVTVSRLLALPPPAVERCRTLTVTRPMQRGSDVRAVQHALAARGFVPGPADGIYGPLTAGAVRRFQAAAGLKATGTVGAATYRALGVSCGPGPPCPDA